MKNQYVGGGLPEMGELGQFVDLSGRGGGLSKKEGVVLLRGGVDTPMPTMIMERHRWSLISFHILLMCLKRLKHNTFSCGHHSRLNITILHRIVSNVDL